MGLTQVFSDIADAIREKSGSSDTYLPTEMAQAILDIPSGSTGNIDMTDITQFRQSSMNYLSVDFAIISKWDGGVNIGATCYISNPIDVTNISKLIYDLRTLSCYGNGAQAQQARWNVMIGLMQNAPTDIVNAEYSQAGFAIGANFANSNTNYGTQEIDVSNLSGNYYFVIVSHGWNANITNLRSN